MTVYFLWFLEVCWFSDPMPVLHSATQAPSCYVLQLIVGASQLCLHSLWHLPPICSLAPCSLVLLVCLPCTLLLLYVFPPCGISASMLFCSLPAPAQLSPMLLPWLPTHTWISFLRTDESVFIDVSAKTAQLAGQVIIISPVNDWVTSIGHGMPCAWPSS